MMYLPNTTTLCLEYDELVPALLPKGTFDSLKGRGQIEVFGRGGNGREVLISYESMPDKYRAMVREKYGDPYEYVSHQPLVNAVEWNYKAEAWYLDYELPTGDKLPTSGKINYVHRYTEAVSWLDMLQRMTADKRTLKQELNISIMTFWEVATALIDKRRVRLPSNSRKLKDRLKQYTAVRQNAGDEAAWELLVEKHKWGNNNSAKVADSVAEAVLKELLAARNKHDDTIVAEAYNRWAVENGRQRISPQTVGYRRKMWAKELMLEREGLAAVNNRLSKKIRGKRPSAPLLLVNSDDNVLDAYFRTGQNDWYRPVLYVVTDSYNDYILGYAWGDAVTKELIRRAYRNAMHHVMELTGGAYLWHQLQADRWGISGKNTTELEAYYHSMGTFTPAALKNPNSKYIEQSFGGTWHQVAKLVFKANYSGHNIGADEQLNRDNLVPAYFPYLEDADQMIADFVQAMRQTTRENSKKNRQEEWLEAFHSSDKARQKCLSTVQRLQIFGEKHEYLNMITAAGIRATIQGQRVEYELSQDEILRHIGKQVMLTYDPDDLSQVLVTDDKGLRLVASEWKAVPRAMADYEEGDAARIHQLQAEKKTLLPQLQQQIAARRELLERARIDAESRLNAGVKTKAIAVEDARLLASPGPSNGGVLTAPGPSNGGVLASHGTSDGGVLASPGPSNGGVLVAEKHPEEGGVCAQNGSNEPLKKPYKPLKRVQNSIYDLM